jgi:sRNA-binding protein
MSQKVQVLLEDDLTGGQAQETIRFGLDGTSYEIDLNRRNAKKLRLSLEEYVKHARRIRARGRRRQRAARRERSADIRRWAKESGIQISDRGRIPTDVVEQYERTH